MIWLLQGGGGDKTDNQLRVPVKITADYWKVLHDRVVDEKNDAIKLKLLMEENVREGLEEIERQKACIKSIHKDKENLEKKLIKSRDSLAN